MNRLSTRYLLTCAVIGVAGGLALMPIFIIFSAAAVAAAPIVYAAVVGIWFLPGALAQNLLRAPAAALTMLFAGLVCVPFTPYGWSAVASTLTVGVLQEIPVLVTRYRVWHAWLIYGWAFLVGVLYSFLLWSSYGAAALPGWMLAVMTPVVALSSLLFTFLGRQLSIRLAKAGVAARPRTAVPPPAPAA